MFHLPLNPIAHIQKPQRSHRYVCVFEHALSNPDSARNIKAFNVDCTKRAVENKNIDWLVICRDLNR